MKESRTAFAFKNAMVSVMMQLVKTLVSFFSRTIFIYVLGAEYLGVNGLFSDILMLLSFAELGVGQAFTFALYKPIADENHEKIKSIMDLFTSVYRAIGIIIMLVGVVFIPFLKKIVGNVSYVNENITLLYLLFLVNTAISYFFSSKITLIIAHQKNYLVDVYRQFFHVGLVIIQSVLLLTTRQYIAYLVIQIIFTACENIYIAHRSNQMFPYLLEKRENKLDKLEIRSLASNVKSLIIYKLGAVVIEGTDSLFISLIVNVATVGLYSNYKMIINIIKNISGKAMDAIIASVGNHNALADSKSKEEIFCEILYITAWFFGYSAIGLCILLSRFISLWLGDSFLIEFSSVFAACLYYYVSSMHYACYIYRQTAGLFVYGKIAPLIGSIINIILDIILGRYFGLTGILWASVICRVLTYEIVDPIIIYKHIFRKKVINYILKYCFFSFITMLCGIICKMIIDKINQMGIVGLILDIVLISAIYNVIFIGTTFYMKEFKSLKRRGRLLLKHTIYKK